jgi:hypothetical protein
MNEENNQNDSDELSIENEILKMKLQLKFGDKMFMGGFADLPPEIENQFLKNILAFEEGYENKKTITVFNKLNKPNFTKIDDLGAHEQKIELDRLLELLEKHNLRLNITQGPYPDDIIYRFITEELFEQEVDEENIDGMTQNFIYEEFHPNHIENIKEATEEFLSSWFEKSFSEFSPQIAHELITIDSKLMSISIFREKITAFFNSFEHFTDTKYKIIDQKYQFGADNTGMGHAEGVVYYIAKLDNGEEIEFKGPFILYFQNQWGMWEVCSFRMPGFELR